MDTPENHTESRAVAEVDTASTQAMLPADGLPNNRDLDADAPAVNTPDAAEATASVAPRTSHGPSALIKLDRSSTSFQLQLLEFLKTIRQSPGDKYSFLKYYQNVVRIFMNDVDIDARGLLVKLEMGLGKSICAIAIAMDMLATRQPIVLLTKSLQQNMRASIHKYCALRAAVEPTYALGRLPKLDLDAWIDRNFSFVSMNASNMMAQMARAAQPQTAREFESALERRIGEVLKLPSLEGKLLIVDEAHNLFRAITNGSKNALALYQAVMSSRDCRIVFLTGTPIANDPFELVPCFNMLGSRVPGKLTLPEFYTDFYNLYVDREHNRVRNRGKFQNRIFGLVSHVTHKSTPGAAAGVNDSSTRIEFPDGLEPVVVKVPMAIAQYAAYLLARDREREETATRGKMAPSASMVKPKSSKSSSYRVRSRQISNYYSVSAKEPSEIPPEASASPKFEAIVSNVESRPGQLGIVYSQFVSMGGIGAFARYLLSKGYEEVVPAATTASRQRAPAERAETPATADEVGETDEYTGASDASRYLANIESEAAASDWWYDSVYMGELSDIAGAAPSLRDHAASADLAGKAQASKVGGAAAATADGPEASTVSEAAAAPDGARTLKFAIISGRVKTEVRDAIVELFNDPRNSHGGIIDLLLLSATGAEGLDLKCVRHIHIMEPYWNYGRIAQVMARGIRNDSHKLLPQEEKNVSTFIYLAVPPTGDELTTDVELYMESLDDRQLVSSFNTAINEVSIECLLNAEKDCRVCNPTAEALYTGDPQKDINLPDPCQLKRERSVKTRRTIVDGKEYYIADNPDSIYEISVYKLDPGVGAFRQLRESDDEFVRVADAVASGKIEYREKDK